MPVTNRRPVPDAINDRADNARDIRKDQADVMHAQAVADWARVNPLGAANGDEAVADSSFAANFHKGLPHDALGNPHAEDYGAFVTAINDPPNNVEHPLDVPLGPPAAPKANKGINATGAAGTAHGANAVQTFAMATIPKFRKVNYQDRVDEEGKSKPIEVRAWESPRAGHVYDLQGADAGAVGMGPAPALCTDELVAEMAEVYALALLRDVSFADIQKVSNKRTRSGATVKQVIDALNKLDYFKSDYVAETPFAKARWDGRGIGVVGGIDGTTAFRGSTPGSDQGPYVSQYMLLGGPDNPEGGKIPYGSQVIDQRVIYYLEGADFMHNWASWLDVQNGANFKALGNMAEASPAHPKSRFLTVPRDLAAYVHDDALYQAYLNATLLLLSYGVKFDTELPEPNPTGDDEIVTRDSFATFGGPHILALVTEVSSRALKAVRRQKFNVHRRGRPEQLAAMVTRVANGQLNGFSTREKDCLTELFEKLDSSGLLTWVDAANEKASDHWKQRKANDLVGENPNWMADGKNYLLPMAFPEGSPMHATYGAGHATVAGACVTVIKAFFQLHDKDGTPFTFADLKRKHFLSRKPKPEERSLFEIFEANATGSELQAAGNADTLTLEGELNKLAANISIGRNMAGVHFYSDYYDSLRMGERVAVSLLLDQMPTYGEPMSMSLTSFDGEQLVLKSTWNGSGYIAELEVDGTTANAQDWRLGHVV